MNLADSKLLLGQQGQAATGGKAGVAPQPGQDATSKMFMTLLLAQIQNQSPLDPADPADFVNQLVQMNQLQGTQNMLSELGAHGLLLRELQGLAMGGQVGNLAMVTTDAIELADASGSISGRLTLSGEESAVKLILVGPDNQRVEIDLGKQAAGSVPFSFDPAEHGLAPGRYQIAVETASGKKVPLELEARIDGVRLPIGGGEPMISLAGLGEFPASYITQLRGKSPAELRV